jgi:hypothetical protein
MLETDDLREHCRRVVRQLISKHDWHLLTEEEYVHSVLTRVMKEGKQTEREVMEIAVNEYVLVFYHFCRPEAKSEDEVRHERAYEELGRYLYAHARARRAEWPDDDLQEAMQIALVAIYRMLAAGRVREPGAFLVFCFNRLRAALTAMGREHRIGGHRLETLDPNPFAPHEQDIDRSTEQQLTRDDSLSVEWEVERRQLIQAIVSELRRKFRSHPKATRQLQAAIRKHALHLTNVEIGRMLKASSSRQVAALISRGKEKLQNNRELEALYDQWFSLYMRGGVR